MNRSITLSATLAAALLAFSAGPSLAQPAPAQPAAVASAERPAPPHRHHARSPEQRQQAWQQRAEAFKQKLQLSAQQQEAWNTWQQSMQPQPHARLERQDLAQLTTPERIDRMRAERAQRSAEADRRGDATKAFYAALTPEQQKTFDAQGPRMRHGHPGMGPGHKAGKHPRHFKGGHRAAPAAPAA